MVLCRGLGGLNAPYGAPCFLTRVREAGEHQVQVVLIHLMVPRTF